MTRFALASLILVVACGNKKADESPNPAPATAAPKAADTPPAPPPPPPTPAPAPAPAADGLAGPFATIEDYCKDVSATFKKDDCWSDMDNIEMCSCGRAEKDDLAGSVTATGAGTHVKGAAIVRVADAASDYIRCSLAFEVAGGWRVTEPAFPCWGAPISHDGGIHLTVHDFTIAGDGTTDTITLAWTQDDERKKTRHSITCTATAAAAITCGAATPPPT